MAAVGQPFDNLAGVRLLDGGKQGHTPEFLVAEREEIPQARAGTAAQGMVDQRPFEIQCEDFDAHPSEALRTIQRGQKGSCPGRDFSSAL
jgi:hypothetical protein